MAALHLLFYLAFTVLLGTLFNARGPIAGLGIGFLMSGQIVPNFLPQLSAYFPWQLPGTAAGLVLGQQVPAGAFIAIGTTIMWTVLFIAAALWRFGREEF